MLPPPPRSTLFPYTTLFRSCASPPPPTSPGRPPAYPPGSRSEEHTSELQSRFDLVCRLLLEKKKYWTRVYQNILRSPALERYHQARQREPHCREPEPKNTHL